MCVFAQNKYQKCVKRHIFKIYCLDIGLLRALSELSPEAYLSDSPTFKEHKGALAENYILQSLLASGINKWFWLYANTPPALQ